MRKIALLAALPLLLGSVALAGEVVSFYSIPVQTGPGVTYNATLTGGYNMGMLDWNGFATAFEEYTYGSELVCDISGPLGATQLTLGSGSSYYPGAWFSGSSSFFNNGGDPAGEWTFDFWDTYDDGSDGQPDAQWDEIHFTFNEWAQPPEWPEMETFNAGFPPSGWTVVDNTGGGDWQLNTFFGEGNYTGGDGDCAMVDSDWYGSYDLDTELISPSVVVPPGATLEFDHDFDYYDYGNPEKGDVDILIGDTWYNLARYENGDFTGHVSLDLSGYVGEEAKIRWRYYDANWEWHWQVDNASLIPEPASLLLLGLGLVLVRRR